MCSLLGQTFKKQLKISTTYSIYHHKCFSVFYPIHYSPCHYKNKYKFESIGWNNKAGCRHFSLKDAQTFALKFYESIANSQGSKLLKDGLVDFHDISGLPWWATLVATTAVFKIFLGFPAGVYQQYLVAKLKLTNVELQNLIPEVKDKVKLDAKRGKWTERKFQIRLTQEVRKRWKDLVVKNNCHPFKVVILSTCQVPIWVLLSITLRKLAQDVQSGTLDSIPASLQFMVGGVFWNPNLVLPDTTLILPTTIAITSFVLTELNVLSNTSVVSLFSRIITNILRGLAVLSFFVSANVPSCVSLYWATSLLFGLTQNLLLLSPKIRKFFKIPKTSKNLEKPYSHVLTKFREKYFGFIRRFRHKQ